MLKQQALIETKIGENVHQYHLPANYSCPLGEAYDVVHGWLTFLANSINEAAKSNERKTTEETVEPKQEG